MRIGPRERAVYVKYRPCFDGAGRIGGRQKSRGNRVDQPSLAHAGGGAASPRYSLEDVISAS